MMKKWKSISGFVFGVCIAFASVFSCGAEGVFDSSGEDLNGRLLFPGESIRTESPVRIGPDMTYADLAEGVWTNTDSSRAYRVSTYSLEETGESGLTVTPEGYVVCVIGGTSSSDDGLSDTHRISEQMVYGSGEEEASQEEAASMIQDMACYPEGTWVRITASDPGEGRTFGHWETQPQVYLEDAGASETAFVMPGESIKVTAVFAERPADPDGAGAAGSGEAAAEDGEGQEQNGEAAAEGGEGQEQNGEEAAAEGGETQEWNEEEAAADSVEAQEWNEEEAAAEVGEGQEQNGEAAAAEGGEAQAEDNEAAAAEVNGQQPQDDQNADAGPFQVQIEGGDGSGEYYPGDVVNVSVPAEREGQFEFWQTELDTVWFNDAYSASTSFVMPAEDVAIQAVYEDDDFAEEDPEGDVADGSGEASGDGEGEPQSGNTTAEDMNQESIGFQEGSADFEIVSSDFYSDQENAAPENVDMQNADAQTPDQGEAGLENADAQTPDQAEPAPEAPALEQTDGEADVQGDAAGIGIASFASEEEPEAQVLNGAPEDEEDWEDEDDDSLDEEDEEDAAEDNADDAGDEDDEDWGDEDEEDEEDWGDEDVDLEDETEDSALFYDYDYSDYNLEGMSEESKEADGAFWGSGVTAFKGEDGTPEEGYDVQVVDGSGSGIYSFGDRVVIQARPVPEEYRFKYWSVLSENVQVADPYAPTTEFIMPDSAVQVRAVFELVSYMLTVQNGIGSGTFHKGDVVNITANWPDDGKEFGAWSSQQPVINGADRYYASVTMPAVDTVVTATYVDGPSASYNRIAGIEDGGQYLKGERLTFTAVGNGPDKENPNPGDFKWVPSAYQIGTVSGGWSGSEYTTSMAISATGRYTLTVTFVKQIFDGNTWTSTNLTDQKSVTFDVVDVLAVQTGDTSPIIPLAIAAGAALAVIVILVIRRRKK